MSDIRVDWLGEATIMMMDLPINFLIKTGGETNVRIASVLGAFQYYYYGSVVKRSGLVLNSNAWDALSALGTTAMGVLYFGETMDSVEWLATGLMLSGLALLAFHDSNL